MSKEVNEENKETNEENQEFNEAGKTVETDNARLASPVIEDKVESIVLDKTPQDLSDVKKFEAKETFSVNSAEVKDGGVVDEAAVINKGKNLGKILPQHLKCKDFVVDSVDVKKGGKVKNISLTDQSDFSSLRRRGNSKAKLKNEGGMSVSENTIIKDSSAR